MITLTSWWLSQELLLVPLVDLALWLGLLALHLLDLPVGHPHGIAALGAAQRPRRVGRALHRHRLHRVLRRLRV